MAMENTPTTQRFLLQAAQAAAAQEPAARRRAAYEASRWAGSNAVTRGEAHYRALCKTHGVTPIKDYEVAAFLLAHETMTEPAYLRWRVPELFA